ncbi:MAG: glycosyl transferase family 90 [Bacteroidia bacterium]
MRIKPVYYIRRYGYQQLPASYFRRKLQKIRAYEAVCNQDELNERLNYYCKLQDAFDIPNQAIAVKDYKKNGGSDYFLDLKDYLHYFKAETHFAYRFGDDTRVNAFPTLVKARPIQGNNANSVLFKLNKSRHFVWVNDPYVFAQKKDMLVWRGGAYQDIRKQFVQKFWNHPACDVGQTNLPKEDKPWEKPFMRIRDQLRYKFICCPEGNDVATNLKWVLSSNSLCMMPKPRYETWFMEGQLIAGIHYVELNTDFSDVESKMQYYLERPEEAAKIIKNANAFVRRFQNPRLEDLLCIKVLERYAALSGQSVALKF